MYRVYKLFFVLKTKLFPYIPVLLMKVLFYADFFFFYLFVMNKYKTIVVLATINFILNLVFCYQYSICKLKHGLYFANIWIEGSESGSLLDDSKLVWPSEMEAFYNIRNERNEHFQIKSWSQKTINAYKDIITRSAKFHTKNQFWKDTFNAYQEIQERLETNDWNKNVCQTL